MSRKSVEREPGRIDLLIDDLTEPRRVTAVAPVADDWSAALVFVDDPAGLVLESLVIFRNDVTVPLGQPLPDIGSGGTQLPEVGRFATTAAFKQFPKPLSATAAPLGVRLVRALPLGELERAARREMAKDRRFATELAAAGIDPTRRPGRRGNPDRHYALIAARYVAALDAGSATPVEDVAGELGYGTATIRNALSTARARSLLSRPGKGRAGGQLTAAGRAALEAEEN